MMIDYRCHRISLAGLLGYVLAVSSLAYFPQVSLNYDTESKYPGLLAKMEQTRDRFGVLRPTLTETITPALEDDKAKLDRELTEQRMSSDQFLNDVLQTLDKVSAVKKSGE